MNFAPYTEAILNGYLFNQAARPADMLDVALIRSGAVTHGSPVTIDQSWYMSSGPGQFGFASLSPMIQAFFAKDSNGNYINAIAPTSPGGLDKTAMGVLFSGTDFVFSIQQYDYGATQAGYGERVFIWGSSSFSLDPAVRFHVDANGDRYITDLAVRPAAAISSSFSDDFDFVGGTLANLTAWFTEPMTDPSHIGKTVEFDFGGTSPSVPVIASYGYSDFIAQQAQEQQAKDGGVTPALYTAVTDFLEGMFADPDGPNRFVDDDGRAIFYGSFDGGDLYADNVTFAKAPLLQDAAFEHGVTLVGGNGDDGLYSTQLETGDKLLGNGGDDILNAGLGDDILDGGAGADALIGGEGIDLATYAYSSAGVVVNLENGTGQGGSAQGDTLDSIENLVGSDFQDILIGDANANDLKGGEKEDVLVGGAGTDALHGGAGSDLLISGTLDDQEASGISSGPEVVDGGAEGDYIVLSDANSGTITVNGGDKSDHLLLMPHMTGGQANGDGSLPLFALVGGVAATQSSTFYSYTGAIITQLTAEEANVTELEDGTKFRSYGYVQNTPVAGSLETFSNSIDYGTDWGVAYYWYFEEDRLEIVVDYGLTGSSPKTCTITINDFHQGDYGITLNEYCVSDFVAYEDNGDATVLTEFQGAMSQFISQAQKQQDASDNFTLTQEPAIQQQGRMMAMSAMPVAALSAEHLVMQISGGDTAEVLTGVGLSEHILGGGGTDRLVGGGGADVLDGGDGIDTADYRTSAAAVNVDLANHTATGGDAEGDTLISIENIAGSAYGDVMHGDAAGNRLQGMAGNDALYGADGVDRLIGGEGADILDGGAGIDTADYSTALAGLVVSLLAPASNTGDAAGDSFTSIENLSGSDFGDTLTGDGNVNRISGLSGNDVIYGMGGNDTLVGGEGADTLDGGAGTDTADYSTAAAGVTVNMLSPLANTGDAAGDILIAIENVAGSDFADTITGDDNANRLSGVDGNDVLDGKGGIDYLVGGAGDDTLTGGAGADVFVYNPGFGHDTITDFWAGLTRTDRVQLIGTELTTFAAVQSALTQTVDGALLTLNGGADTILFAGLSVTALVADDFVFA